MVHKQILPNGLTVLVDVDKKIPKVSIQLWYKVGSKDEQDGEKGIAHFIEHMIFKGTTKLSECDINLITHKLSGYCNAYTSYDYTGYLFDLPSQHWYEALPILADCMRNCTFKEDFLRSELKAVIQELKMYKDDYTTTLIENMVGKIFPDHPYHFPIIGYKQDLWNLSRESLVKFYNKHYIPNNATLVVVGDVNPEEVLKLANKEFGPIQPNFDYNKREFYHGQDLISTQTTIYRDIQQPFVILAFTIPGSSAGKDYITDIFSWVFGSGASSRLYKKLVEELQIVTELESFSYDLFDYGVYFVRFQPKSNAKIDEIINIICSTAQDLASSGPTAKEIERAIRKTEVEYLAFMESIQKKAYAIGKNYLATGNENYIYEYTKYPQKNLAEEVKNFVRNNFHISALHIGKILPIESSEKKYWDFVQDISDKEDSRVLSKKVREIPVESGACSVNIHPKPPKAFQYGESKSFTLNNGLKIINYNNPALAKIDLILDFQAKYYYDPTEFQGLSNFVMEMLLEGTENYSSTEFAEILESYGMSLYSSSGKLIMSMRSEDFLKGLELLSEVVLKAAFRKNEIEKIREQLISRVKNYWDSPTDFASQLVRQAIYKNHPFSKCPIGTEQSIKSIKREDLINFYSEKMGAATAKIIVVGDLEKYNIKDLFEKYFSKWSNTKLTDLDYPELKETHKELINYPIIRDQIVLVYTGLSVDRLHPDYDKLLLFEQIFSGGLLGSMSSRLFDLRERSGLFYTISGSLLNKVTRQPGTIIVKTLVSADRLFEAEKAIEEVIDTAIDTFTQEELDEAKSVLINSLVDNFSSNLRMAHSFLAIDTFGFSSDYFNNRATQISSITLNDVKKVVKLWLSTEKLIKIRIGRVPEEK